MTRHILSCLDPLIPKGAGGCVAALLVVGGQWLPALSQCYMLQSAPSLHTPHLQVCGGGCAADTIARSPLSMVHGTSSGLAERPEVHVAQLL